VDEIALAKRELIEGLNGHTSTAVLMRTFACCSIRGIAPGRVLTYASKSTFFMAQDTRRRGRWIGANARICNTRIVRIEHRSRSVSVQSFNQLALRERNLIHRRKKSRCAGETRVTTPTSGMAIAR